LSIATPKTRSLIDTIGTGYRALNRRPWVVGLPIGLSALLWLTPPLVLGADGPLHVAAAVESLGGATAEQRALLSAVLTSDLRSAFAWLNFVPILTPAPGQTSQGALTLTSAGDLVLAMALINAVALLVSTVFLTFLCGAVRDDRFHPVGEARQALRVAGTLVVALLVVLGVGIILGLPFLALSALLIAMLPAAALPVLLLWYIGIFWAYIYAGFTPEAILLSRSGPLQAIYNSVNLVRRNFAGTLGLLLVSIIITSGLAVVWRQLGGSPLGLTIALVGSAYIGSGLSAARMEFYRERMALWKRAV
jgi:hypothetical protein